MTDLKIRVMGGLLAAFAIFAVCPPSSAQTVLRASHQFPGGKGDVRDDMVQLIAKGGEGRQCWAQIQVYPGASLFKPAPQWTALVGGQLDISLYSLDYASGMVPEFSATLMPGLIRSQERAKRINQSQFMKDIHAAIEKHNVIILSDAWFPGAMASSKTCIEKPADMQGMVSGSACRPLRPCGRWRARASSTRPQTRFTTRSKVASSMATETSLATFGSMRLYEVTKCFHRAGQQCAVVHVPAGADVEKKSFDKLTKQQQAVLIKRRARTHRPIMKTRLN